MKRCPVCTTPYPNSKTTCDTHRVLLIESKELDPETIINNKWEILRTLGAGGMGIVYLARHIPTSRLRALKFLNPQISHDPKILKRFHREACIELRHPNIVQIFDSEHAEDGSPFIPMEYVEGSDLRGLIGKSSFSIQRSLSIARGIALGLTEAHGRGILHRDIKPENILISTGPGVLETPKILDFGIAAVEAAVADVTRTRGQMFTPEYASPEQWLGFIAEDMDGRVDIYALGVVLFEMLTGRTDTRAVKTDGRMYANFEAPRLAPSRLRPEVAEWPGLDDLALRMVAREREDRPENAQNLVEDLEKVLRKIPPTTRNNRTATRAEFDPGKTAGPERATAVSGRGETGFAGQVKTQLLDKYQGDQKQQASRQRAWYALIFLIIVMSAVCAVYLKVWATPDSSPSSTSATPQANESSSTIVRPPPPATARVRVTCNLPCSWSLDNVSQGQLVPEDSQATGVRVGEATVLLGHHVVVARGIDARVGKQSQSFDPRASETMPMNFVLKSLGVTSPPPPNPGEIQKLLDQAASLRQQGDNAGAYATYQRVLVLDPDNDVAKTKMKEIRNECDSTCPGVPPPPR